MVEDEAQAESFVPGELFIPNDSGRGHGWTRWEQVSRISRAAPRV
jgi:hypothetical protein